MKCCVLMAHVPDTASIIKVAASGARIEEAGIKWIVSPYDEYALEEAIKLKETKGGSVTVVAYGPDGADRTPQGLRECLARGADAAVHVRGDGALGDAYTIARVLAAAVSKVGPFDLVLTGVKGVGSDNSLVGAMVAELLDLPHVAGVTKIEYGEGKLTAHREIEGGTEIVDAPLPCLIMAHKGLNEPRYPSLKGIMASKRVPIQAFTAADLGFDEAKLAGDEARARWRAIVLPAAKSGGTIIQGEENPTGAAAQLARLLREQAKAI
jgi:electron transfer flavoprotein beta subunit